jgi:hypothetical protein
VYATDRKEGALTLQVSGYLWERSLVIRDLETGSLWSHLLGKCMDGKLKGETLEVLPGVLTTWKDWSQRHPETTVLAMSRTAQRFDVEVWKNPEKFVYGVPLGLGREAPAVTLPKLMKSRVVAVRADGEVVLVTFDLSKKCAQAFDPTLDGEALVFSLNKDGRMVDAASGSTWDLVSGQCLKGKWKGRVLSGRPGIISYRKPWEIFHPDSEIVE